MAHLGVRFRLSVFHPRSLCRSASAQTRGNRIKAYSIRQILALIVFSLVIPACLIAIGFSAKAYYDGRDSVTTSTLQTAHALTLVVERELIGLQSATATPAFSPQLQNGDLAAFHAQARDVLRATAGFAFVLTDRSGQQLVNTSSHRLKRVVDSGFLCPLSRFPQLAGVDSVEKLLWKHRFNQSAQSHVRIANAYFRESSNCVTFHESTRVF